jgi:hypothetical protein
MAQKLRVRVNPWLHTDDKGRPCCVVPLDPELKSTISGRYVGAQPVVSKDPRSTVAVAGVQSNPGIWEQNDVAWTFDTETVFELDNTAWYRQQIKDGALVAVDAATASLVGIRFVSPELALTKDPDAKPVFIEKPASPPKSSKE